MGDAQAESELAVAGAAGRGDGEVTGAHRVSFPMTRMLGLRHG